LSSLGLTHHTAPTPFTPCAGVPHLLVGHVQQLLQVDALVRELLERALLARLDLLRRQRVRHGDRATRELRTRSGGGRSSSVSLAVKKATARPVEVTGVLQGQAWVAARPAAEVGGSAYCDPTPRWRAASNARAVNAALSSSANGGRAVSRRAVGARRAKIAQRLQGASRTADPRRHHGSIEKSNAGAARANAYRALRGRRKTACAAAGLSDATTPARNRISVHDVIVPRAVKPKAIPFSRATRQLAHPARTSAWNRLHTSTQVTTAPCRTAQPRTHAHAKCQCRPQKHANFVP